MLAGPDQYACRRSALPTSRCCKAFELDVETGIASVTDPPWVCMGSRSCVHLRSDQRWCVMERRQRSS